MGEPKAFASLSSGLLARKGAARPAMRPQGFGQVGAGLDDLGWNDMGFEAPRPALAPVRDDHHDAFGEELSEPALRNPLAALTPAALAPAALTPASFAPAPSPVHDQQAEIADRFADYTEESSDEESVDETAELYDPEAEAAAGDDADAEEEQAIVIDDSPVLSVKPNRAGTTVSASPLGVASLEAAPLVVAPAAVAPAPVVPVASVPVPAAIVQSAAVVRPARAVRPRAEPGSKAKAAFTLRLDAQRHLKLRLACAVTGRSAQQLVTDALDELLGSMPELETMAERAPKKHAQR